ncbi:hypothetical protein HHI36_014762 [Cryptolaemus montrouzieri]|uniref:Uncharacterized protein n=1 Tax=Cryptolaemus montrouzieri TaxID=559131 RepID=A0ABD2N4T1_9CUCU
MDRALRVIDLNPLPIKKENMKRKRAEEEAEEFEIDLQKMFTESVKMHNNNSGPMCSMGGDRSMGLSQCIFEI